MAWTASIRVKDLQTCKLWIANFGCTASDTGLFPKEVSGSSGSLDVEVLLVKALGSRLLSLGIQGGHKCASFESPKYGPFSEELFSSSLHRPLNAGCGCELKSFYKDR